MGNTQINTASSLSSKGLFDLDSVKMDSPRLKLIKKFDVQTYHSPWMEEDPWIAVPMNLARSIMSGYDASEEEKSDIPSMMAGYCGLLEGVTFFGDTERDVQDQAIACCMSNTGINETVNSSNQPH